MEMSQVYLNQKIEELKQRIGEVPLSSEQETETEAWFLHDFFLIPVEHFITKGEILPISMLHMMQQVIRGVYPYWIDNDEIYAMGRKTLTLLSLIGRDFGSQQELDEYWQKHLLSECEEARLSPLGKKEPFVSVILPTHNRCTELGKAMQSVLDQTYDKLELIVVSDGSTDETERVVKDFSDARVRFIRSEKNGGLAYARNMGSREARYALIAFHDDDDLWRPEKLEKQVKTLLDAGEGTGFCYCEMKFIRLDGKTVLYVPRREISTVRKSGYLYPELLRRNFIGGPTLLVRKECFDTLGLFDERLAIFEDWDMVLRLSKKYDAAFVPEPLYDYFEHEKSLTTDRSFGHRDRIRETLRLLDEKTDEDKTAFGYTEKYIDTYNVGFKEAEE